MPVQIDHTLMLSAGLSGWVSMSSVSVVDSTTVWAAGNEYEGFGVVVKTTDGGASRDKEFVTANNGLWGL